MSLRAATTLSPGTERPSALPIVERSGVRYEVVEIIRQAIWAGTLQSGQRLNEQWLANELAVSRPPLREAIRVLEQEGLIESRPRRGAYVASLTGDDIMEIYELRCSLEGTAAEAVAANAPNSVFDALDHHLDEAVPPGAPLADAITHDLEFHRMLVRSSRNRRLLLAWENMVSQLRLALVRVDPEFYDKTFIEATHRQLVAALRSRDRQMVRHEVDRLLDVGRDLKLRWDLLTTEEPAT